MTPDATPRRVLLLGATSEIGLATVRALDLAAGSRLVLAGRDWEALADIAATFPSGVRTSIDVFDALDPKSVVGVIDRAFADGGIDVVIPAFGVLGEQERLGADPGAAVDLLTVNVVSQVTALLRAAHHLRAAGTGTLVVLSSIAAVRPRRANFGYGASKAALDAAGRGLADSLHGSGVRVLVVRPGFVIGRMTAGMKPAPLATTSEAVGAAVAAAIRSGRSTLWVPPALWVVAVAMRLTPRALWRRTTR